MLAKVLYIILFERRLLRLALAQTENSSRWIFPPHERDLHREPLLGFSDSLLRLVCTVYYRLAQALARAAVYPGPLSVFVGR